MRHESERYLKFCFLVLKYYNRTGYPETIRPFLSAIGVAEITNLSSAVFEISTLFV